MATTGAIVRDPHDGSLMLFSSLPVFETDTVALEDLYTMLVANGARSHLAGPLAVAVSTTEAEELPASVMGFPARDVPSLWDESEFEHAAALMRRSGIVCNVGTTGLTAEFPWEEGAGSAMFGDHTSLMTFRTDETHLVAGNGLFFRLDLPLSFEREQLAESANYLNVFETTGVDVPPFFGAWCSQLDNGTLTYVGFWPNCMYKAGTVANIASWCRIRSNIARLAIAGHGLSN
jgi:hypothetical protein